MDAIPGWDESTALFMRLRPYVRHCGDSRRPAWEIGRRRLLDYMLVYIAEGTGHFSRGNDQFDVKPGDLFWVPPDTDHAMEGFAPFMRCPYIHFDLLYDPARSHWEFSIPPGMCDLSEFAMLMHPPLNAPELDLPPLLQYHNNTRIGDLVIAICQAAEQALPGHQWRMTGLLWELLAELHLGRVGHTPELHAHIPLLEEAAGYLRGHCAEETCIGDAAEMIGICHSYFRRLFNAYYGCPPREYRQRARIMAAKSLMTGTSIPLSEIARRVGFSSVQNFSRAFRHMEGISPSDCRRCGPNPVAAVEGRGVRWPR